MLGLTRTDLNLLLSLVEVDRENQVAYRRSVPECIQLLMNEHEDVVHSQKVRTRVHILYFTV